MNWHAVISLLYILPIFLMCSDYVTTACFLDFVKSRFQTNFHLKSTSRAVRAVHFYFSSHWFSLCSIDILLFSVILCSFNSISYAVYTGVSLLSSSSLALHFSGYCQLLQAFLHCDVSKEDKLLFWWLSSDFVWYQFHWSNFLLQETRYWIISLNDFSYSFKTFQIDSPLALYQWYLK